MLDRSIINTDKGRGLKAGPRTLWGKVASSLSNNVSVKVKSWLTPMMLAGYKVPSVLYRGSVCIFPMATIATSGTLITGDPYFPPMEPKFDTVIVPPVTSSLLSLFVAASCVSRESSSAICNENQPGYLWYCEAPCSVNRDGRGKPWRMNLTKARLRTFSPSG